MQLIYPNTWYQVYSATYILMYPYVFRGVLALAPHADRTRTLSGDLCLDDVACEDSRLIRPKEML